jgi:hypothetical protein
LQVDQHAPTMRTETSVFSVKNKKMEENTHE